MSELTELVLKIVHEQLDELEARRRPPGRVLDISAKLAGEGGAAAGAKHYHMTDLDKPPAPAQQWLEQAAARTMEAAEPPQTITEAARRLMGEMAAALVRGQVDAVWSEGSIVNKLRALDLFDKAFRGHLFPKT